jgi:MFS family permease
MPYLPLFLQKEGHSSVVMIGVIAAAFYLGTILSSSLFGWLSDLAGRKPMMITGMSLLAVSSFLFTRTVDPQWFLLFRLLEGISASAGGVMLAFVADISAPTQRSRALGLVMSAQFGGAIVGPALGAAIYYASGGGRLGFHAIFYFGSALAAVTAVVMAFLIREPTATGRRKAVRTERERRPSYREVLRPAIVGFLVVGFAANFAFGGFEVIWSIWLARLGASMSMISAMWIAMSVPMLLSFVGGILADRYSRFVFMFAGNGIATLGFVIIGVTRGLALYLVVVVVQGLAFALAAPAKQGFLVQASPSLWIGVVQGLDSTSMQLGGLVGTLLIPALYNAITGYAIVVCGAVFLTGLALAAPVLGRESKRLGHAHATRGASATGS